MHYYKEQFKPLLQEYDIEFFSMSSESIALSAMAHVHCAVEILYIAKGVFRVDVDSERKFAKEGDIVLFASNSVHSVYHTENKPGKYFVLKLTPNILFRVFKGKEYDDCIQPFTKRQKGNRIIFQKHEISNVITTAISEMISEYTKNGEFMYTALKLKAFELLFSIYRDFFYTSESNKYSQFGPSREIRTIIYESVEYINNNYASNITPFQCAKSANLSYNYYNKMFHAIIGRGFKEYLTSIRLATAYNALVSTDLSVTDIAIGCGYNSTAYFIAEFKKVYGATPGEARKSHI